MNKIIGSRGATIKQPDSNYAIKRPHKSNGKFVAGEKDEERSKVELKPHETVKNYNLKCRPIKPCSSLL